MLNAAIFDMDGTLLDSQWMWDSLPERYLRSKGYDPEPRLGERMAAMSVEQGCVYLISAYGLPFSVPQVEQGIMALMADFYQYQAELKPNAGVFLKQLYRQGVKLCVVTATPRALCQPALERCGIMKHLDFLLTVDEFGGGKDRPDIFLRAAERLGSPPEATLVFEDAPHAARTARNAGFPVIGIGDPTTDRLELEPLCREYWRAFPSDGKWIEKMRGIRLDEGQIL